jgi:hypothetical protein
MVDYQYGKLVELWLTGGKLHIGREYIPRASFPTCNPRDEIYKNVTECKRSMAHSFIASQKYEISLRSQNF